jgi:3-oxoacyl-[acyl-carrier-protein] synthase III
MQITSKITGIGSHIPAIKKDNSAFLENKFYDIDGKPLPYGNEEVIKKFFEITGIESRRYASDELNTSDLATKAAQKAIEDANIDPEEIDQIIVAHNFGDVSKTNQQSDILPSMAARVKHNLKIKNNSCVAYDILFGCPGWIQGVIQADSYIKAGIAKNVLVIGAETLSRVVDPYDRDSMIYADGAGASVISKKNDDDPSGIISYTTQSHTLNESRYLQYGESYYPHSDDNLLYVKMQGRKIYEFSLSNVPLAMKFCLDESGEKIENLKKIFIHQANEKMDQAIVKRFYRLYGVKTVPENIMPMSIHNLGNSSVATIPTLLDLVYRKKWDYHNILKGDLILFASVGAGMHINAFSYRI